MKTTICILAILFASLTSLNAQISVNMPIGYSSLKAPVIGLNLQGGIGSLRIVAGFDKHISNDKLKGNLFYTRIGAGFWLSELNSLEITAGAGQFRVSTDDKSLNKALGVVNVQYVHQMAFRPEAAVFASVTGTNKFAMFTGGLRFTFRKHGEDCPSARRLRN